MELVETTNRDPLEHDNLVSPTKDDNHVNIALSPSTTASPSGSETSSVASGRSHIDRSDNALNYRMEINQNTSLLLADEVEYMAVD